jgi:hypothetical protein
MSSSRQPAAPSGPFISLGDLGKSPHFDKAHAQPVAERSTRFKAVQEAVELGLDILDSPRGRAALASVGKDVVKYSDPRDFTFKLNVHNMDDWVDRFLDHLNHEFIPVLTTTTKETDGLFNPMDWARHGRWTPENAGALIMSAYVGFP